MPMMISILVMVEDEDEDKHKILNDSFKQQCHLLGKIGTGWKREGEGRWPMNKTYTLIIHLVMAVILLCIPYKLYEEF